MTTETREALKEFARALTTRNARLAIDSAADRLIRALEQEATGPCGECGGSGVVDSGGVTPWGTGIDMPCPSCELARKREREPEHSCGSGLPTIPINNYEDWVAEQQREYETWRDEQLDTLRKLFVQRGPMYMYQSFPDFCREQWEGSGKGKVKV